MINKFFNVNGSLTMSLDKRALTEEYWLNLSCKGLEVLANDAVSEI